MRKIILTAIGLAMFATPLAADTPHAGIAQHEKNRYGLDWHTPAVQVPVGHPQRFVVTPSGQSFGLASPAATQSFGLVSPAGSYALQPYSAGPNHDLRDRYGPIHR
jgi:hypothetical protein